MRDHFLGVGKRAFSLLAMEGRMGKIFPALFVCAFALVSLVGYEARAVGEPHLCRVSAFPQSLPALCPRPLFLFSPLRPSFPFFPFSFPFPLFPAFLFSPQQTAGISALHWLNTRGQVLFYTDSQGNEMVYLPSP